MPLLLPGSAAIGPRPASGPATLPAFLASIAKASFYGIYTAGQNMAANSDGSGGAVADGGAVGCWTASDTASWTAKFIQATSASRPAYGATISGGQPAIYGNGTSWSMALDSATALDRDHTILMSVETMSQNGYVFTQNGDQWSYYQRSGANPDIYWATNLATGNGLPRAGQGELSTTYQRIQRIAISTGSGTAHYGNAMRIFSGASAYFATCRIRQIAFVPKLTGLECARALPLLV